MSTVPETPKACCNKCTRPMRPRGVTLKKMPGTMAWGHSGQCKSCVQPNGPTDRNNGSRPPKAPKPVENPKAAPLLTNGRKDVHLAHTISGLNSFMAERERRLSVQASKQNAFLATGGHRLPAQAPKAAVQRPLRRAA